MIFQFKETLVRIRDSTRKGQAHFLLIVHKGLNNYTTVGDPYAAEPNHPQKTLELLSCIRNAIWQINGFLHRGSVKADSQQPCAAAYQLWRQPCGCSVPAPAALWL